MAIEAVEEPERHYWMPSGDDVRHAFRGRRWERQGADTTVCGVSVALYEPDELDWISAPTCLACNRVLRDEQ